MRDEEDPSALNAHGEWFSDLGEVFEKIDRGDEHGRQAPWRDLWSDGIRMVAPGGIVSPEAAGRLQQKISNALYSVASRPSEERTSALQSAFEEFFPLLESVYARAGAEDALDPLREQLHTAQFFSKNGDTFYRRVEFLVNEARSEMNDLKKSHEHASGVLEEAKGVAAEAAASAREAAAARDAANVAAGEAGTNALADEFALFRRDHASASRNYRAATIAVLVLTVATAILFVLGLDRLLLQHLDVSAETTSSAADLSGTEGQRWQAVVYRLAILAGLAGLSAYLGRQAGLHRRLHDWGRAVEAQARSFEAFAKQIIDPETKRQVQLLFSSRVLGAPPEPTADKTVARDALQIVTDAAIRNRPNP